MENELLQLFIGTPNEFMHVYTQVRIGVPCSRYIPRAAISKI